MGLGCVFLCMLVTAGEKKYDLEVFARTILRGLGQVKVGEGMTTMCTHLAAMPQCIFNISIGSRET